MSIFVEGGKPENPEKNPQSKARTNNKLNPHLTPGPGFEPGPHWSEASALTTAPTLCCLIFTCGSCFLHFPRVLKCPSCFITVLFYSVTKHSDRLRTLEKCRKHSPAARVLYISLFSNDRRVLSQCNTRLRLLYLLNKGIFYTD